jgi:hypothetical protein
MEILGKIGNRQILYLSTSENPRWYDELPEEQWLLLPIGHESDFKLIDEVVNKCLENDVCYVCAVGHQSELIHDTFDQIIVKRKIDEGQAVDNPDDFLTSPMTTWDTEIDEGLWFAGTSAFPSYYTDITKIICLDLTETGEKETLIEILAKISKGWVPSN